MKRKLTSCLEIVMMIVASFAFVYFVAETSELFEVVSAQDDLQGFSCCEQVDGGGSCQAVTSDSECAAGLHRYTTCEQTSMCRKGCCIDDAEGTYDKNVAFKDCFGRFEEDENCNVPGAEKGCCIIGSKTYFNTQQNCVVRTSNEGDGSAVNWDGSKNELECYGSAQVQEEGACLLGNTPEGRNCKFGTKAECVGLGGDFVSGYLCTGQNLGSRCEKTDKTMCVDGKDEVYFKDTCGNPGNIYDASKKNVGSYWETTEDTELCGEDAGNGNADSKTCGNCNRFLGGICASSSAEGKSGYPDFYCKDTSCSYDGENYKNGESWCVYDGKIGDGDDVVGSRHWKYVCNQGEIQIEPCADYRNQICTQSNTFDVSDGEIEFRSATCIANNWRECIDLNRQGNIGDCENTLNCRIEEVNIADSFSFQVCTPKYPGGFIFQDGSAAGSRYGTTAEQICGMATQTCTVIYVDDGWGDCECVQNCECEKAIFTEKMNDFCRKLGDCGLETNVEGKYTKNYDVSGAPELGSGMISKLVNMANPIKGQFAEVEDYTGYLEAAGLLGLQDDEGEEVEGSEIVSGDAIMKIGGGAVGLGLAAVTYGAYLGGWGSGWGFSTAIGLNPTSAFFAGFAGAAIGFGIGMIAGNYIAEAAGLSPIGSIMMTVGAGVVGAVIGVIALTKITFSGCVTGGPVGCAIAFWVGVAMIIGSLFFGGADCDPVEVTFTCKPWQPPSGVEDCKKCNDDLLRPCSEYRCKSLGAGCELVNKGGADEMCDSAVDDGGYPQLDLDNNLKTDGVTYNERAGGLEITNQQGGCLNAYQPISLALRTDEPAQCKFDLQQKNFEDMVFDLGTNAYVYDHSQIINLPDPSHGQSKGVDWNGDVTFYIKCQDRFGHETPSFYLVNMCVRQGPDETAPVIQTINPQSESMTSFNKTEKDIIVYTNEIAECKWSEQDKDYLVMENSMDCLTNVNSFKGVGICNATVPTISSENIFYIRCKDQPWLEAVGRGNERNANQQSYNYVLKKPSSQLKIDWVMPEGEVESSTYIATVVLKVQTSGGGEYHSCDYSFSGYDNMIDFNDFDYDTNHEQIFNQMIPGRYRVYVECGDETGDKDREETSFKVIHDATEPQIARIYVEGGRLKLVTDEEAECVYSKESCVYGFNEGTGMGGFGFKHNLNARSGETYYIKCKDEHGKDPGNNLCSIRGVIKPIY